MSATPKVTSPKNPLVRRFRAVAAGAEPSLLTADGVHLVEEALQAGLELVEVAVSSKLGESERGRRLFEQLQRAAGLVHDCSEAVLQRISNLATPQGVVGVCRRPPVRPIDLLGRDRALIVVAARVQDPGNLGALIRTGEAAGATGLIALEGGADPFRDKAVRGSAGSVFRLPTLGRQSIESACELGRRHGLQLLIAEADAEREYWQVDLARPSMIVFGGEGGGVPEALRARADDRLRVPIAPTVDSLNVAVAAGIVLFDARRQRR